MKLSSRNVLADYIDAEIHCIFLFVLKVFKRIMPSNALETFSLTLFTIYFVMNL